MREIKKSFWDYMTVLGSSFLAIPIMIVSESIQAKSLGTESYGKVGLVLSAISLLYLFSMNWLRLSIMRFGKEEFTQEKHLRRTFSNFIIITFFILIVTSSFFLNFKKPVLNFLEIKNNSSFWVIILGFVLATGKQFIFEILKVIRLIKVQTVLFRLLPKFILITGLGIFLFASKITVNLVIALFLFSDICVIFIGLYFIKFKYLFPFMPDWKLMQRMAIFSLPLVFSSWSGYIVNWIDVYVIKYFMTLKEVGLYHAAYKIFETYKSIAVTGLITIFTPIIMVYKTNNNTEKIKKIFLQRLLPQISFISMLIISFIIIISDYAFELIYGEEFIASIIPFKILIASQNISAFRIVFSGLITAFDKTKTLAVLAISAGVINIIADIILVPVFGIIGAAFASYAVFTINPIIWYIIFNNQFKSNRYLALLFPIVTFLIMLVNIISIGFYIKCIISILLVAIAYLVGRHFSLFCNSDIELLDKINMPLFLKKFIKKTIIVFSK